MRLWYLIKRFAARVVNLARVVEASLNWQRDVTLILLLLLCVAGFHLRHAFMTSVLGCPGELLDSHRSGYCVPEAMELLRCLGSQGRTLYADTQLTLDMAFPLLYGSFFAILMVRCLHTQIARFAVYLPPAMACIDLVENGLTAAASQEFETRAEGIIPFASFFTQLKWTIGYSTLYFFPFLFVLGSFFPAPTEESSTSALQQERPGHG